MTTITQSYKKHYIHVKTSPLFEVVEVQIVANPNDSFSTAKVYTVKSIQAAKIFITKHVNSLK